MIQPSVIVRCRSCRTYINPFITFQDHGRRWRCNVCNRVNDCMSSHSVARTCLLFVSWTILLTLCDLITPRDDGHEELGREDPHSFKASAREFTALLGLLRAPCPAY